ncbi:MAG: hypothetical protein ABSG13_02665 [Bryobacteraceae bacterium]|jgi:hypothetical protein
MSSYKSISKKNQAIVLTVFTAFIPIAWNTQAQTTASASPRASWMNKLASSWTEDEARLVLERSPWAKTTVAGIARRQTEDERRAGGNMGQPTGVGFDGIDDKRVRPILPTSVFTAAPTPLSKAQLIRLLVRWESALPVRVAELKTGEAQPPTLSDDGYSVAVYGVPFTDAKGDPLTLARDFKESAFLRRDGKKDVKPIRVEAFELEHSAVVVYLFPYSAEISKKDGAVEFTALIGRLQVSQTFNVEEMQFQGKLEL